MTDIGCLSYAIGEKVAPGQLWKLRSDNGQCSTLQVDSLYDKWASLDILDSQAKYKRLRGV